MPDDNLRKISQLEQGIAQMKDNLPMFKDALEALAKNYFIYYEALKKSGFTEQQALYLVGVHGASYGNK
jgi:hypothetical protein